MKPDLFILLFFLLLAAMPQGFAGNEIFDDLDKGLVSQKEELDTKLCQRALYSTHFDSWLKAYLAGDDKKADEEWAQLLKQTKGATSLRALIRGANNRIIFLEGKDRERSLARGDLMFADRKMLASTQKTLGKDHVLIASIDEYISNCHSDYSQWADAAIFQMEALRIREKNWGRNNPKIARDLRAALKKLYKAKRYKECQSVAQRMIAFGTKYGDAQYTNEAKSYLALAKRKQENIAKTN